MIKYESSTLVLNPNLKVKMGRDSMPVFFDTLTLYYMLFIINFAMAIFFTVYMRATQNKENLNIFVLSKLSQGTTWFLLTLVNVLPIWMTTYLSDTTLIIGWALESAVFVRFKRKMDHRMKLFYVISFAIVMVFIMMDLNTYGYIRKIAFIVAYAIYISTAGIVLLASKDSTKFQKIMGYIYAFNSLITVLTFFAVLRPDTYEEAMNALKTDVFSMALMTSMQVVGSVGFLLLVNERDKLILEEVASIDELSGILNRRYFFQKVDAIFASEDRLNRFAMILIDLDHFKQVNDKFGHMVGDQVIRDFSSAVSKSIGPNDIFARYGGEEFILFLPNVDQQQIQRRYGEIRKAIAHGIEESHGELPEYTVSVGFVIKEASYDYHLDELLKLTDFALYHAKNSGRNCMCGQIVAEEKSMMSLYR